MKFQIFRSIHIATTLNSIKRKSYSKSNYEFKITLSFKETEYQAPNGFLPPPYSFISFFHFLFYNFIKQRFYFGTYKGAAYLNDIVIFI